jgi:hypothetical protein
MFFIVKMLLYDAIPCINLKDLCKKVAWLDLNVNECKQNPNMGSFKMNMFRWKMNVYKNKFAYGKYVLSYYYIDLCSIKF